jgi:NADH-quinone oxidoreductase subunit G
MPTIIVDGQAYEVSAGSNLLEACLSVGLDLPYFCWHPALGSVGACRQCAVVAYQDENDDRGRLTMACMTPVSDGARLSVAAPNAVEFRESVVEWLMLNHPHDCPVCEEGGECHLQDMTVMTGHTFRATRAPKRTFENQYLGPFINHEMNRCITCYRCVRFYRDYAGGEDLQAFGSRNRVYFGRAEDGTLESPFSGNLVEVCPTGVFTDKPFSNTYSRKWDLQSAPSICSGCGLGCNILPGERYGTLKRIHNRYHSEINGYFLCDRGRFGANFVNAEDRFRSPGERREDGSFDAIDADTASRRVADLLESGPVVGIGSPRASLESNHALRTLVGAENFSPGMGAREALLLDKIIEIHRRSPARIASLKDAENADAVLILGEDVTNSAPRLALSLRQATRAETFTMAGEAGIPLWQDAGVRGHAQHAKSPLFSATPLTTDLDDVAEETMNGAPVDIARLGFSVADAIDPTHPDLNLDDPDHTTLAHRIARALLNAERPLVVSGTGSGNVKVLEAAANIATALASRDKAAAICLTVPECNSYGAALLGGGLTLEAALDHAASGAALLVLENDLTRRVEPDLAQAAFSGAAHVVALDVIATPTVEQADLVLPAATFAECEGTFVNNEGRAQRYYEVFAAIDDVQPGWRWLCAAAAHAGRNDLAWQLTDEVTKACSTLPSFSRITECGPDHAYRSAAGMRVPRQPHRYSGRTAMNANVDVHEPKARVDEDSPLSFSMEGASKTDSLLNAYVWAPGWNSNQSVMKFQQEVGGPLKSGVSGIRLTAPDDAGSPAQPYLDIPPAFAAGADLTVVPLQEIFGTDELSMRSPPIADRAQAPCVVMNPADANRLGIGATDGEVGAADGEVGAPSGVICRGDSVGVRIDERMSVGVIGIVDGRAGSKGSNESIEVQADPDYRGPFDDVIARGG